jgi:hypothetical protein
VCDDFTEFEVSDAPVETILVGEVVDDAHLQGVLARLHSLGVQVSSMRAVPT